MYRANIQPNCVHRLPPDSVHSLQLLVLPFPLSMSTALMSVSHQRVHNASLVYLLYSKNDANVPLDCPYNAFQPIVERILSVRFCYTIEENRVERLSEKQLQIAVASSLRHDQVK